MIKKDYMKPTMVMVHLHHRAHILVGSYDGIQTRNMSEDYDDVPSYDNTIKDVNLWDAN